MGSGVEAGMGEIDPFPTLQRGSLAFNPLTL